jgi:hypothetical protein
VAEWINLFALGECTVEVVLNDSETLFSGVMAQGDTETFGESPLFTLSVTEEGAVVFDGGDEVSYANFDINVIPSYDHDFPARIRAISIGPNVQYAGAQLEAGAFFGESDPESFIGLESLDPISPDPLDMTALTGNRVLVGGCFTNGGVG